MYVNEDYLNYKYLVTASDNYVVLTNQRQVNGSWDNPRSIDVIYQYFKPSFVTLEGERVYSTTQTFEQVSVSDNEFERADFCDYMTTALLFLSVIIYTLLNGITRFFKKGGIIYGQ